MSISALSPMAPPSVRKAHDKAEKGNRLWAELHLSALLTLDDSAVFPSSKEGETTHPHGKADGQSDTDGQYFTRVTRQFLPTTSSNNQGKWIINRKNK